MSNSSHTSDQSNRSLGSQSKPLPGKLSLLSLALASALASMTPAMAADTTISTAVGPQTWTIDNFTVTNTGDINGGASSAGVYAIVPLGTLSNSGAISSGFAGVYNSSTSAITSLINNNGGTISGTFGIFNDGGGIDSLSNSGTISGSNMGLYNNLGTITALSNSLGGTISGGNYGMVNNGGTIGTLSNGGLIDGSTNQGIYNINGGLITTLNNSGTISSNGSAIINSSSIGTLSNSGTIGGGSEGVVNDGSISTLSNSGLISGSSYSLNLTSGSALGSFTNSGTIAGEIFNDSGTALSINGGTGATFGTITGFSAAIDSASIGDIVSLSGLNFVSGNQLLNANITASTVNNTAGVLQVNNPITISGDYVQNTAATLAIGVSSGATNTGLSSDTGYGRLIVAGNTTIDTGSSILLKPVTTYTFASGQRFVVVQTTGTATYNAASLNYSASGFTGGITGASIFEGGYTGLVMTLGGSSPTPSTPSTIATDGNAIAALTGLSSYNGLNQGLFDIDNAVKALPDAASANRAGAQLSPSATNWAIFNATRAVADTVQLSVIQHLDSFRMSKTSSSGVASGEGGLDKSVWGRAFGGNADQDQRSGVAGYHANYGGLMFGADTQANADWRVGGVASYAHTNVDNDDSNNGSSAAANAYGLTAYAGYGYDSKPWYVNMTAGAARQNYTTTRDINFPGFSGNANGRFHGNLYTLSTQAGYPLPLGAVTLTPLAGLNYSNLHQDSYTESGGNGAALNVNDTTSHSLKSDLGVKVDRSFATRYGTLTPSAQLSWRHEFVDTRLDTSASFAADPSGSTAFTTQGASPLRNTARLALGVTMVQSDNLSLLARYSLDGASGYTGQTGDLTVRWQF